MDVNDTLVTDNEKEEKAVVPTRFELMQNYPNPFNPETNILFRLASLQHVSLKIYSTTGNLIKTLVSSQLSAGEHMAVWDGTNDAGEQVSSGVYFAHLKAGVFTATRRMVLLR